MSEQVILWHWTLPDAYNSYIATSITGAGSSTPAAWLQFLVIILAAYPVVQKKAHEEIDMIVGSDRSPVIEDLKSLPYIQAIISEVTPRTHYYSILAYISLTGA